MGGSGPWIPATAVTLAGVLTSQGQFEMRPI